MTDAKDYPSAESIKRPLELGEKLLVACLVKRDGERIISFTPIINHPHSDRENGQPEIHYHADYRFIKTQESNEVAEGFVVIDERDGFKSSKPIIEKGIDGELEYHVLPVVSKHHNGLSLRFFIRNSKLKHKCIQNGKCPHRGYDLSQEKPVGGIITCPLHALEFHAENGKITDRILEELATNRNKEIEYKIMIRQGLRKINRIKNGDTISLEQYNELKNLSAYTLYRCETIGNGEYMECKWQRARTDDFPPKPLEINNSCGFSNNLQTLNFKVELKPKA